MKKLLFMMFNFFVFYAPCNGQRTLVVHNNQNTETRILNINNPAADKSLTWTDIFNNTQSGNTKEILLQDNINPSGTFTLSNLPNQVFWLHFVYTFIDPRGQQAQQKYQEQVFMVPAGNNGDTICINISNLNVQMCS